MADANGEFEKLAKQLRKQATHVPWWKDARPWNIVWLGVWTAISLGFVGLTFTWVVADSGYLNSAGWGFNVGAGYILALSILFDRVRMIRKEVELIRELRVKNIKIVGEEKGMAITAEVRDAYHGGPEKLHEKLEELRERGRKGEL